MGLLDRIKNRDDTEEDEGRRSEKFHKGQQVRLFNGAQSRRGEVLNVLSGGKLEVSFQTSQGEVTRIVDEDQLFPADAKLGPIRRMFGK